MIDTLSNEQLELIPVIRDRWLSQLYDLKDVDKESCIEGVKWLYNASGLDEPEVRFCKSINEAQRIIHERKYGDAASTTKLVPEALCSYGDISDHGWVAFYDYFTELGILNEPSFNSFKKLLQSNYFTMIQMSDVCYVVENPIYLKLVGPDNILSSVDGYAIEFKDGTGVYFVNGVYLDDSIYRKLANKLYTMDDFSAERNEETKAACLEFYRQKFGDEYAFNFIRENLKEVDEYIDKKPEIYMKGTTNSDRIGVYTLFAGTISNGVKVAYVRCYDASSDRIFFLSVDPNKVTTAKDAVPSLYRVPRILEPHILSINRQGERYSTNFTAKGKELLNTISEDEVKDLVDLSGDRYYDLIRYEY